MSATNRGAERMPQDFYETPAWCVHRLFEVINPSTDARILEPCAGTGAIIEAAPHLNWHAIEIDRQRVGQIPLSQMRVIKGDFLKMDVPEGFDWVVTNPPYSQAEAFISKCLSIATNVVMLLRLNFLGSQHRCEMFHHMWGVPAVYVLPNRPSFIGGKTDATEYAWFHWHKGTPTVRILNLTPIEER